MSILEEMTLGTRRYHQKFAKLCDPMKRFFGVTHLVYIQIEKNDRLIALHTNADWVDYSILEKQYHIDDPSMVSPKNMGSGAVCWGTYSDEDYLSGLHRDNIDKFDHHHGISFVRSNLEGYKLFGFVTSKENHQFYNNLMNNMDCVEQFISYLDIQLEPIRQKLHDHKVNFAEAKGDLYHQQISMIPPEEDVMAQYRFLRDLGAVDDSLLDVKMTKREQQCIQLYLQGHSATSTAKQLFLSPRTVESYMENIKRKLNLNSKRELFDKMEQLKEAALI